MRSLLFIPGDDERNRLTAEPDAFVVERPERRAVRCRVVLVGAVGVRHGRAVVVGQLWNPVSAFPGCSIGPQFIVIA